MPEWVRISFLVNATKGETGMKRTIRVVTPEVTFEVEVPAERAVSRAFELVMETGGRVTSVM